VRQALASAVPPPREAYPQRPRPAIGRYAAVIDEWLLADRDVPPKQRHTARRVWQRLVAEQGAGLAEVTVSRYVARRRAELGLDKVQVMVPQAHAPGAEAEVDFGEFHAVIAGVLIKLWMFVMRLSCSGRAFHVAFATQAQEAFLEDHVLAFEYFGAVPARVRYDNLGARGGAGAARPGPGRIRAVHRAAQPLRVRPRSSASRAGKARTRKAGWKARSAGSAAATWSPSPPSRRWPR
jgi:transposase